MRFIHVVGEVFHLGSLRMVVGELGKVINEVLSSGFGPILKDSD